MPIAYLNIHAGQSNAEGMLQGVLPQQSGVTATIEGRPGVKSWYGAEHGFVEAMRANGVTDHLHITKLATGATSLRNSGNATLDWSPDSRGELFDQLVGLVRSDVQSLTAQGYTVVIQSFSWLHGEAHTGTDATGAAYEALVEDFVTDFRNAIGVPTLNTQLIEIVENPARLGADEVNVSLHNAAASLQNVHVIETDGLDLRDGLSHFDPSAYFKIGERWAAGVLDGAYTSPAVTGSSRADLLQGDGDKDIVFGKGGQDVIKGFGNTDLLYGGNGDDTIFGGEGGDYLGGDNGNDVIHGEAGNDTVWGANGDDSIEGGAGADRIDGVAGIDTIMFTTSAGGVNVNLHTGVGAGFDAQGDTYTRIERVVGSGHRDVISGDAADNLIRGEGGADRLYGREGADELRGGAGNDVLYGGAGADLLFGESSTSSNTYVFRVSDFAAGEQDTIFGLTTRDRLELTGYDESEVTLSAQGGDTLITLDAGAVDGAILVKGWTDMAALSDLFAFG